ncbi:CMGC/SRPK protein kinase [Salpingoeca rosetta]|uniref:non-specific serine/threonine protein kinase n=1 Tax=Salpingoeca rosetta (strain ATCC 50818 / BSB-021) TaxID=946362 RepID=F2TVY3_SALR5|nr:CMGC/SRPK protein kinase [Salpingoeca rosetta]EGD72229.1 CMGC/SRPK protein kinase [Salpingoeca rosetta]|eukprot:XP_004998800.1 CMGC/SRPK protein kinase [Salpingoeca rosetta]
MDETREARDSQAGNDDGRRLAHAPSRPHISKTVSTQEQSATDASHGASLAASNAKNEPSTGALKVASNGPAALATSTASAVHAKESAPRPQKKASLPDAGSVGPSAAKKIHKPSSAPHQFDDASDDEEEVDEYKRGGYHPVFLGDKYKSKYLVVKKLGWGHFSTVWLVEDSNSTNFYAMKIVKSASHYTEAAQDEIKLMREVAAADPRARSRQRVMQMIDDFRVFGPFGTHVAMVFEVMGHNLLRLIRHFNYRGLPSVLTKRIIKQTLQGLDYLHSKCSIIHTDIKPENILMCLTEREIHAMGQLAKATYADQPPPRYASRLGKNKKTRQCASEADREHVNLDDVPRIRPLREKLLDEEFFKTCQVKIADLGNACWVDKHFAAVIQTRQYRSLEAILGNNYDQSADIWSVAALTFELATGDYLFDPHSGRNFDRNEDHIAMIIELLGPIPRQIVFNSPHAPTYFDRNGNLRHIKRLKMWPLQDVLMQKYKMHKDSAKMMTEFLLPMLRYEPLFRATASECARHGWLKITDEDNTELGRYLTKARAKDRERRRRAGELTDTPNHHPQQQQDKASSSNTKQSKQASGGSSSSNSNSSSHEPKSEAAEKPKETAVLPENEAQPLPPASEAATPSKNKDVQAEPAIKGGEWA